MSRIHLTDDFIRGLGVEAYRVGGSVRDEVIGRTPKDADYIVRGVPLPDLGGMLARGNVKVTPLKLRDGRQAGWRASKRGFGLVEIVLPRTEVPREPKPGENTHRAFDIVVDHTLSLQTDALRRDFTFNALYRDLDTGEVLDPTGRGVYDLRHRFVAITHYNSFRDDPLRILRALRFVSTLGYDLSDETYLAMLMHHEAVTGLSAKGYPSGTVLEELSRLLMGDSPAKALRIARDTGVLATALPEIAPMLGFEQDSRYHDMTTDEHTFAALDTAARVDAPLRVRMALLFHDSGKPETAWVGEDGRKHYYATKIRNPMLFSAWLEEDGTTPVPIPLYITTEDHEVVGARLAQEALTRLNAPRSLRNDVIALCRNHMVKAEKPKETKVHRERVRLGDDLLHDLYLMRMCDLSGKGNKNEKYMKNVAEMELMRRKAAENGIPASVKELNINGHDIAELGGEGAAIGNVLRNVLDEVVCQPNEQLLSREWQLQRAAALLRKQG